jgi:hypothetical protein
MNTCKIDIRDMVQKEVLKNVADYKQIEKDRLDFGFDSIYFRYAILCDGNTRADSAR